MSFKDGSPEQVAINLKNDVFHRKQQQLKAIENNITAIEAVRKVLGFSYSELVFILDLTKSELDSIYRNYYPSIIQTNSVNTLKDLRLTYIHKFLKETKIPAHICALIFDEPRLYTFCIENHIWPANRSVVKPVSDNLIFEVRGKKRDILVEIKKILNAVQSMNDLNKGHFDQIGFVSSYIDAENAFHKKNKKSIADKIHSAILNETANEANLKTLSLLKDLKNENEQHWMILSELHALIDSYEEKKRSNKTT